jgi:DNA polymerase-3 subunit beta
MNFIVSSASLLKHLQSIGGVLSSSNTLPILDNFLFDLSENSLSVSASDMETTMTTQLKIESKDSGIIAIPARLLLDILKTLPNHPLTFVINPENFGIEIVSDYGKYKLSGQNGDEFPKMPNLESSSSVKLHAEIVLKAINTTLFATGNDDLRPVMCGVFCQLTSDNITFVATDAHKLVRYIRKDAKSSLTGSFILPKKPLNLLKNLLSNTNETGEVSIEYNKSNALFSFNKSTLVCRLIDGKYPNYEAVIPQNNPNKLTIDRLMLLNSIKRVSIFSNKTTHQVRLRIAGSELNISAEDLDFANEASERLNCQYEGRDIEIGFNSKFLIEMLSNIESDEINLELSDPNRAGIFLPNKTKEAQEDLLMLVMPVMLN